VYDVCKALLLAELIDVVEAMAPDERPPWWPEVAEDIRVHAAISDVLFAADEWAEGHEEEFLLLVAAACDRLSARGVVTPGMAHACVVLDDMTVIWRGNEPMSTEPVVTFGHALAAMAAGTYPEAPPGHQWFFGTPDGVRTI